MRQRTGCMCTMMQRKTRHMKIAISKRSLHNQYSDLVNADSVAEDERAAIQRLWSDGDRVMCDSGRFWPACVTSGLTPSCKHASRTVGRQPIAACKSFSFPAPLYQRLAARHHTLNTCTDHYGYNVRPSALRNHYHHIHSITPTATNHTSTLHGSIKRARLRATCCGRRLHRSVVRHWSQQRFK